MTNDREHGQQFRAAFLKVSPPTTPEGIEKDLGSGMIRGIGPASAKRDLKAYHLAHQTFANPDALTTAIHAAVLTLNAERSAKPLVSEREAAE